MNWLKKHKIECAAFIVSIILIALIINRLIEHNKLTQHKTESTPISSPLLIEDGEIILGLYNAPQTIILFYSYNCTPCTDFFKNTYQKLYTNYIEKGQVRLILKPINLTENKDLTMALETLYCLHNLGQFEAIHELLLTDINTIYTQLFKGFTNSLIQNNQELQHCLTEHQSLKLIKKNNEQLTSLNIQATPTFVIGHLVYTGAMDFKLLDNILKKQQQ